MEVHQVNTLCMKILKQEQNYFEMPRKTLLLKQTSEKTNKQKQQQQQQSRSVVLHNVLVHFNELPSAHFASKCHLRTLN